MYRVMYKHVIVSPEIEVQYKASKKLCTSVQNVVNLQFLEKYQLGEVRIQNFEHNVEER